jgi:sigma-B regulation protein RsbU (phosphoserine phosphatase)
VALESLGEGVIIANVEGRFLAFNPRAESILGIGLRDVGPDEWSSVYGCYKRDTVTPYPSEQLPLARAIRGEVVADEVIYIRNPEQPDGVWISVTGNPLIDTEGSVGGGVVILRDITDQQQAATRINQLVMAVEQTADSIIITDREGVIEYVNSGFEATTGFSRVEAVGKTPRILRSGRQTRAFYQELWAQITAGRHFRATLLNRKKNGELFWAEQTITPLRNDEGVITHYVSVLRDITELREKQQQDIQLELARQVQQELFPVPISLPGFDIAGAAFPADQTGGDYYDFIRTSDGTLWLVVGDVSGHGISSALTMAETRAYIRSYARLGLEPGELLAYVNQELTADPGKERFVPTIVALLDPIDRSLIYANAGHTAGYLLDATGAVLVEMRSTGVPLGALGGSEFASSDRIELPPGSVLVMVTDGITEARDAGDREFGIDRVLEIVRQNWDVTACTQVSLLYEAACAFVGGRAQEDDVTAVVLKVDPNA